MRAATHGDEVASQRTIISWEPDHSSQVMMITVFSSRSRAEITTHSPPMTKTTCSISCVNPKPILYYSPSRKSQSSCSHLNMNSASSFICNFSVGHTDYVFSAYVCLSVFYYSCVFNGQTEVGVESDLSGLLELEFVLKLILLTKGRSLWLGTNQQIDPLISC